MEGKAGLRIAYSNKKIIPLQQSLKQALAGLVIFIVR
jgi:hypothetical protein